jgi:hypothetical protein
MRRKFINSGLEILEIYILAIENLNYQHQCHGSGSRSFGQKRLNMDPGGQKVLRFRFSGTYLAHSCDNFYSLLFLGLVSTQMGMHNHMLLTPRQRIGMSSLYVYQLIGSGGRGVMFGWS